MGIFEWYFNLYNNNPLLAGAFVPFYMAALGLVFATVADVAVRFTGIHLGDYKKEYEDDEVAQEAKSKAH